jgi:hypothetical protein
MGKSEVLQDSHLPPHWEWLHDIFQPDAYRLEDFKLMPVVTVTEPRLEGSGLFNEQEPTIRSECSKTLTQLLAQWLTALFDTEVKLLRPSLCPVG